jgi:hypothetical protein
LWQWKLTIHRCGDDAKALEQFVDAQKTAFRKILKKYQVCQVFSYLEQDPLTLCLEKWTGSPSLGERFKSEILGDPKSFTKRNFDPLLAQYMDVLSTLRSASPDISEASTPRSESRRPSTQIKVQTQPQAYWNEYDDGSEAENEPYAIYINPDAESTFPGAKTMTHVLSIANGPVERMKKWWSPTTTPGERQSLIGNGNGHYFGDAQPTDTEADDEAYASSSDFPSGYTPHYATFPSVMDQKLSRHHERLLFQVTLASFGASLVLLIIAGTLVATGRHRLRIEVDAAVIVGVVASLTFATLGFGTMLYRKEPLGWLHRACVGFTFMAVCVLNGMLLVLVAGNTGL